MHPFRRHQKPEEIEVEEHPQIHRALEPGLEEFRVLILHTSPDFDSTIQCQLVHTALSDMRPYEALSYVWGKPEFTQRIQLDDKPFYITSNLETALKYLRYPGRERTLWVDAICIDQANIRERNDQVGRMRDIYGNCVVNLFWLGEPSEEIYRGFKIMKDLAASNTKESRPDMDIQGFKHGQWRKDRQNLRNLDEIDWETLRILFTKPKIWNRVWIVQEICCAPEVLLLLGNSALEWSPIERALSPETNFMDAFHAPYRHEFEPQIASAFEKPQTIKHQRKIVREMRESGHESALLDVLAAFRFQESTDPLDKYIRFWAWFPTH